MTSEISFLKNQQREISAVWSYNWKVFSNLSGCWMSPRSRFSYGFITELSVTVTSYQTRLWFHDMTKLAVVSVSWQIWLWSRSRFVYAWFRFRFRDRIGRDFVPDLVVVSWQYWLQTRSKFVLTVVSCQNCLRIHNQFDCGFVTGDFTVISDFGGGWYRGKIDCDCDLSIQTNYTNKSIRRRKRPRLLVKFQYVYQSLV